MPPWSPRKLPLVLGNKTHLPILGSIWPLETYKVIDTTGEGEIAQGEYVGKGSRKKDYKGTKSV